MLTKVGRRAKNLLKFPGENNKVIFVKLTTDFKIKLSSEMCIIFLTYTS